LDKLAMVGISPGDAEGGAGVPLTPPLVVVGRPVAPQTGDDHSARRVGPFSDTIASPRSHSSGREGPACREDLLVWDKFTMFQKGLVLISAPLLFQLAFFALLADMHRSNARAVNWSIHSKEVLRQTQVVLRNLLELGTGMRGFVLSADPDLAAAYERAAKQLPQDVRDLESSVSDNPEQAGQVRDIASAIEEYMAWHAETVRLAGAGQRDQAIARARSQRNADLQEAIVRAMMAFIRTEDALDKERTRALEQSRARQQWLLWSGAGATLLIMLALAFVFSRSVAGRLATLTDNATRLVRGEPLAPPVPGRDEVAQLDQAFRGMAAEVAESEASLRRSAEATRVLYEQARRSGEEIRLLNEGLELRIAERTAELARANDALREADRGKDEFLAMLSHELRNPLAPVRNALQVLKMPGVDAAMARDARELMERQLQQMVRLVDDLLDVSRILRGRIELRKESLDLAAVFARAVETARPRLDARGQELTVTLPSRPLRLEGDLVRLAQVVGNLLVNAAKYSDKPGRVWLTGERDGGEAVIRVRDSGVGIPPEQLPRIFDLFAQGERSLARSQGGLGIGLTLVRRLAQMHGGSVSASSPGAGQGSEFVVRLPALPGEPARKEAPAEEPLQAASQPRRVLVVDDNVDAAESAAMLLRYLGHEVEVAYEGPSALGAVSAFRPEVVLLDIGLPGMSGYDVARELRERPEGKGLVLAAVTGYGQEEDRRRSREAGFDCHLTKPLAPAALAAFLESSRP
jgi:signal transduction histidine kinase